MRLHTGDPCFGCGKKLQDNDDVVVCPECGTPYHRECWAKNNKCINIELHQSGATWQSERKKEEEQKPERICPNCGTANEQTAQRCQNCGASMEEPPQLPSWEKQTGEEVPPQKMTLRERWERAAEEEGLYDLCCGMNQEDVIGGEQLRDVADFVGNNTLYYLPKFRRFHEGHRLSLNFPCLIFPQFYFANRKMWLFSMILIAVLTLLHLPQMAMMLQTALPDMIQTMKSSEGSMLAEMYPNMQQVMQGMLERLENCETFVYNAAVICNYLEVGMTIVLGLFGNWLYYRFVLRQVHQIAQEDLSREMRRHRLRSQGGTNGWLIVGMVALQYLLTCVMFMVLFVILMV
ncbi:MAG: RING finger protein [Ruminococcus sp.]